MATWIFILHLVFPITTDLPNPGASAQTPDDIVRYRGLEQMFARFEAEDEPA